MEGWLLAAWKTGLKTSVPRLLRILLPFTQSPRTSESDRGSPKDKNNLEAGPQGVLRGQNSRSFSIHLRLLPVLCSRSVFNNIALPIFILDSSVQKEASTEVNSEREELARSSRTNIATPFKMYRTDKTSQTLPSPALLGRSAPVTHSAMILVRSVRIDIAA